MRFAQLLAQDWHEAALAAPEKAKAADTPLRNSNAGDCSLKLWYDLSGYEPEPFDEAGVWVTELGNLVHRAWQESIVAHYPMAQIEFKVANHITSGHLDATVSENDWMIALELKTMGGTGFRRAVGAPSGYGKSATAHGPRLSHVRQLAVNALLAQADEARLCYVALEAVAKGKEDLGFAGFDRFCAEWTWTKDEFTPIAHDELRRFVSVVNDFRANRRPVPEYEGKIINPPGEHTFPCGYCGHQRQCLEDAS